MKNQRNGALVPTSSHSSVEHDALISEVTRSLKSLLARARGKEITPEYIATILENLDNNPNIRCRDTREFLPR